MSKTVTPPAHDDRACPVCGDRRGTVYAEANLDRSRLDDFAYSSRKTPEYMHHRLLECPVCRLLYASPLPDEQELASGYGAAAFDSSTESRCAAATYARYLESFLDRLPDRQGALDIGTGDGAFLEQLQALGFTDCAGVEPSRAPIAAARAGVRHLIRQGMFRAGDFAPGSFSLITCFQTLEHLSDPAALVAGAWRLLKPGGALYTVCHDRHSLSARILGSRSPIFDIEHLQLFSPASTRVLLESQRFTSVDIAPLVNRYPLRYWLRLIPLPRVAKQYAISLADRTGLGSVSLAVRAGNLAAVGFKPQAPPPSPLQGARP